MPKCEKAAMELAGKRFGRLTVIERVQNSKSCKTRWLCKCDCGNNVIVVGSNLKSGNTESCGCLHAEILAESNTQTKVKHGHAKSRLYTIWTDMKQRCGNPNDCCYAIYGGRGISVCEEWKSSFQAFYDWAMSHGYSDHLSIDRVDNESGYSPDNCRWATAKEQVQNRRRRIGRKRG